MKKNLIYILSSVVLFLLHSCGLEEISVPEPGTSNGSTIEFVARPTYYDEFNVATKVASNQINDLENKIYTAFFMLYDNDGNRVLFKDLTSTATSGGAISHTVVSDKGLSNATACFLANVSTDYAKSLKTVADLKGDKPLNIEYESVTARCIGIPMLTDKAKSINKVYSIPMAGVFTYDMSNLTGSGTPIQIPLERLFAKVMVNMTVNLTNPTTRPSNFTLSNYVVRNMPTKVAIMAPDSDPPATLWAASTVDEDYLTQNNVLTNFNYNVATEDDNTIEKGKTKAFFFYVPEHMVPKDMENEYADEVKQNYKPTLFNQNSTKRPLYVSVSGGIIDENGNDGVVQYDIYLGENEYDDFNIKRNKLYNNTIIINGTDDFDHRVELTQGDITVSFKRASHLDSHFEVRPLRVQWTGKDDDGNPKNASGTITIEVLNASDGTAIPNWVRLERPLNPDQATYCGSQEDKNIGKRRYFTTDLVTSTLASSTKITYNITSDANGDAPTWVYVDEYVATSNSVFTDNARQAKIRVQYTPEGASTASHTVDYVITQRSVFPIVSQERTSHTYGMEFFEEYLYNYDDPNIQDSDDFQYDETQNGIPWGLDGILLSRNYQSIYFDDVTINNKSISTAPADAINYRIMQGTIAISDIQRAFDRSLNSKETMLGMMNTQIAKVSPFYDFYVNEQNSVNDNLELREYEGYKMNVEIIHFLLSQSPNSSILLNQFPLDEVNPLSVIAYCYNKNKRDAEGNIVTVDGETIYTSNLHWYAPSIDELMDLTSSAYRSSDYFDDVFNANYYWSCQPSYKLNTAQMQYMMDVNAKEDYYKIDKYGFIPVPKKIGTATISAESNAEATGNFLTEHEHRSRATRLENGSNIASGIGDIYNRYLFRATGTMDNFGADFISQITRLLNPTDWNNSVTEITSEENVDYGSFPGNQPRTAKNRVRCVYNPDPPKRAVRSSSLVGEGYSYQYYNIL